MTDSKQIVFTAAGVLSRSGDSIASHVQSLLERSEDSDKRSAADYSMKAFKPAPYLSDKRVLKSVSNVDALGLAAIELLKKNSMLEVLDGELPVYLDNKIGLYAGAPPSSPWNVSDYFEALQASRNESGECSAALFGASCMNARPTTLLTGLPNNVLCYGAIIMNAKGPNSNYTSGETSGQLAVINAARRIETGKLDAAVAGAFSAHAEPVISSMFQQNGLLKRVSGDGLAASPVAFAITPGGGGTILAEGAFFYLMERRENAEARGAPIIASYAGGAAASAATGEFGGEGVEAAVSLALKRCLAQASVDPRDIGLVLTSAAGIGPLDWGERRALARLFTEAGAKSPATGTTARIWGNLMEAGGLAEIAMVPALYARGALPDSMRIDASEANLEAQTQIDPARPYALVIRTAAFAEASCLLIRNEA